MDCNCLPINNAMANYIEAWNLYAEFNRAWIEMYLNAWQYYLPRNK